MILLHLSAYSVEFSGLNSIESTYRSGTVNFKSFVGKFFLRIKWKFELTVHFKHEIIGNYISQKLHRKFELSGTSN